VGAPGSGRVRRVTEARWQWYRKGYPSIAGHCTADQPYGAWRHIISELFREQDADRRRHLAGKDTATLKAMWPQLPVPEDKPLSEAPSASQFAQALAGVFRRSAPIAIVLWDVEQADPGTASVLRAIVRADLGRALLWVTSIQSVPGLAEVPPPTWDAAAMTAMWADLVPGSPPPATLPNTAHAGLAQAWTAFAKHHALPPPPTPLPPSLVRLSILEQPFPRAIAVQVAPDLDLLIQAGHLRTVDIKEQQSRQALRFTNAATHTLARLAPSDREQDHRLALTAWETYSTTPRSVKARVHHSVRAKVVRVDLIDEMIRVALDRGTATDIRRWLNLRDMAVCADSIGDSSGDFFMAYARLYTSLRLEPTRVTRADMRALAASADTPEHRAMAAHLKLMHTAKGDDRSRMAKEGRKWSRSLAQNYPALAARILRETALVHLTEGAIDLALVDAERAVELARKAAHKASVLAHPPNEDERTETEQTQPGQTVPIRLTQSEVIAATTHTAALVYAGQPARAAAVCERMAIRCQKEGHTRGHAAFLVNRSIALLRTGDRITASACLATARAHHHKHGDLHIIANWATIAARLAVERGDLQAGIRLIDEAITAAQATKDEELLAETWAVCLDAAAQAADPSLAQRALSAYGSTSAWSPHDHWPAALARWHWATGDLDRALAATDTVRLSFGGLCVKAERARMLLLCGDTPRAIACTTELLADNCIEKHRDVQYFVRLIEGAANGVRDADFVPLVSEMRERQWVHLYLGALHLDAIRRRRRGENVASVLRLLESRSADIGHAVYSALARAREW
jgi:hypothetical protein